MLTRRRRLFSRRLIHRAAFLAAGGGTVATDVWDVSGVLRQMRLTQVCSAQDSVHWYQLVACRGRCPPVGAGFSVLVSACLLLSLFKIGFGT